MKAQKEKQQAAKNLAEMVYQSKANEVAGASQNWNGTAKKNATTELTIVQDFHQVRSVSNTTEEEPKKEAEADKKKIPEIKPQQVSQSGGFFNWWFQGSIFKKIASFLLLNW